MGNKGLSISHLSLLPRKRIASMEKSRPNTSSWPAYAGLTEKASPDRYAAEDAEQKKQDELLSDAEKRDLIQRVRQVESIWDPTYKDRLLCDYKNHRWAQIYKDMVAERVLIGSKANGETINGNVLRSQWKKLLGSYYGVSLVHSYTP